MAQSQVSRQVTFGGCKAQPNHSNFDCERCPFTAAVAIIRPSGEKPEYYCRVHAKDTWLKMAGVPVEREE